MSGFQPDGAEAGLPDIKICLVAQVLQAQEPLRLLLPHARKQLGLPQDSPRHIHLSQLCHFQHHLQGRAACQAVTVTCCAGGRRCPAAVPSLASSAYS